MTSARPRDAGLTLVEVLVVLAIVGIATGVAVLGLGALDRGARSEAEAMRLAHRLQLAADEVMVSGMPLALIWDDRGYRFVAWDAVGKRWRESVQRELGMRHVLSPALRLEVAGASDNPPILITPDLPQPPVILHVAGVADARGWRVTFDGFGAAVAAPGT